jgi:uncharacterized protein YdaU (DUF1376 family)
MDGSMHYYKFNIADWHLATSHLSLEEEAIYFKLVNFYYDTETPIPLETQTVIRRLRLGLHSDSVRLVLDEFFVKTEKGFVHERCDSEIQKYHKKAETNKTVGKLGGRPKKIKDLKNNPQKTQTVSENNPQITLTTNHKPITKSSIQLPEFLSSEMWAEWIQHRRSIKAPMSDLAQAKFINQLTSLVADGHDSKKLLDTAIANGWKTVYPKDETKLVKAKKDLPPEWRV